MSSLPVRRQLVQPTRALGAKKIENVAIAPNASSRIKALAIPFTTQPTNSSLAQITSRLTLPTAASKAKSINAPAVKPSSDVKLQPQRTKRPVLVEVTQHANNLGVDGKEKSTGTVDRDGDMKGKGKQPQVATRLVKAIASRVQPATSKGQTKVVIKNPGATRPGHVSVPSTSTSTASSIPISTKSTSTTGATAGRRVQAPKAKAAGGSSAADDKIPKQTSTGSLSSKRRLEDEEAEQELNRVFKKPHTSPPVAQLQRLQLGPEVEEEEIADELGEPLWEDLDADDWDDPQMVSEYVADICKYWQESELKTLPDRRYMDRQRDLTWEHRSIIIDWMVQFHLAYPITHETIFLFINIMDRFLCIRQISPMKLHLVAAACFFIACKYEETIAPLVVDMIDLGGNSWTERELLLAEKHILSAIGWDLSHPGPMGWLRRGSKADDNEVRARTVSKYLLEIGYAEWRLVGIPPSLLAAAALWFSRLVLGREDWTPTLEHYTTCSEQDLLPVVSVMVTYLLRTIEHPSLFKKYSHKRYYQCSVLLRMWVLERWPENTVVDLRDEVDLLKAEAREFRKIEEHQKLQDTSDVF
ncbi:hypothetical protein BDN72DRAFT_816720 [Pluteus cervinus]|uniref:Uncharacterized protein n=1 Tax=Pluteus cervinus TaxID=181527 RepID=A0ACD3B1Y4_9AGAR|nr:hypothetical protein BDN72DRAFT_816720 [Pluteus cervinus]